MNSAGDFPYPEWHVKVDNTHLSAAEVALRFTEAFRLPVLKEFLS
jgi:hypothetical protein